MVIDPPMMVVSPSLLLSVLLIMSNDPAALEYIPPPLLSKTLFVMVSNPPLFMIACPPLLSIVLSVMDSVENKRLKLHSPVKFLKVLLLMIVSAGNLNGQAKLEMVKSYISMRKSR